ncbi:MAG: transcription antitermination factor NusB [Lentisphaeria bacterium]|nr:transcription antitermination factor NusB [Lentisphaeria bacterium]
MDIDESLEATPKLHTKRLAREIAMQYLFCCDMLNEFPELSRFDEFFEEEMKSQHNLSDNRYSRKSREIAENIIAQIALNLEAIDTKIKDFAKNWEWERISHVDRNIMRVAVYEMLFDMDVPPIVSINEGVEIARDYADEKSANFINGVLNAVKDSLDRPER